MVAHSQLSPFVAYSMTVFRSSGSMRTNRPKRTALNLPSFTSCQTVRSDTPSNLPVSRYVSSAVELFICSYLRNTMRVPNSIAACKPMGQESTVWQLH